MIRTKIFETAAAMTVLAATTAMAQDITVRGSVYNNGYNYNRGYDANAAYGTWDDDDAPVIVNRGGYARYGNNYDGGYYGGSAGVPTRSDRGATNGYNGAPYGYRGGYASSNGFVCDPGSVFINENGKPTLCQ